jgi:hypothetical protein
VPRRSPAHQSLANAAAASGRIHRQGAHRSPAVGVFDIGFIAIGDKRDGADDLLTLLGDRVLTPGRGDRLAQAAKDPS